MNVMICCNHGDDGLFTGAVEAVEIADEISIVGTAKVLKWRDSTPRTMKVGRRHYVISNHQAWVGNWCWDSVEMDEGEAKRLVGDLLKAGWTIESWSADGPFAALATMHTALAKGDV